MIMQANRVALLLALLAGVASCAMFGGSPINDADAAVRLARAAVSDQYGEATARAHEPWQATLSSGVWIVRGSLLPDRPGGPPEVNIRQSTGEVISVYRTY